MAAFTNAKQSIPPLFLAIMVNHAQQQELRDNPFPTWKDVLAMAALKREMAEYRRGAERALCWNKDKGNTA